MEQQERFAASPKGASEPCYYRGDRVLLEVAGTLRERTISHYSGGNSFVEVCEFDGALIDRSALRNQLEAA